MSNYDKEPKIRVHGCEGCLTEGFAAVFSQIETAMRGKRILTADCYPGVRDEEILPWLLRWKPALTIRMADLFKDTHTIREQLQSHITDDRIFGKMYYGELLDFIDPQKLAVAREQVRRSSQTVLIYGFGASLIHRGDLLCYLDLARWEIQLRYRRGMTNYFAAEADEDALRKIKQGFFIEWRVADKHKMTCFSQVDYFLDTNREGQIKMVSGHAVREGLRQAARRPFRPVPYFDPGVWGGQWMKEVCGLPAEEKNFAWAFDGVPEENSLYLDFGNGFFELPCMDLILYQPREVLGAHVYSRFGAEFPIRFDFLDTMGGQNLSLQVHPLTEYIHRQFGMAYTQDESYYLLDAREDAAVYLGLRDDANPAQMLLDLERANRGEIVFDAEKYVNRFPAKKHDHFLIPAGTCHCSGKDAMVLEISATPYCFTFKLWDWGRVGLDGKPRPIHIEHGREVIQWNRRTDWVKENLVNAVRVLAKNEHYTEEHTGLHELEFIETRRYWIRDAVTIDNEGNVNMLNLVEGSSCVVESTDGSFDPYTIHYAETFIVPACVDGYRIVNPGKDTIGVMRAFVR